MRVLINDCHGGFGLSAEAVMKLRERGVQGALEEVLAGEPWDPAKPNELRDEFLSSYSCYDIPRDDPDLLAVFDELGDAMNGQYARLKVVEIPEDVDWYIEEYDGQEWVAEEHKTWH